MRGFTLIEVVVGMALISILLAATFGILHTSVRTQQFTAEEGAKIQDGRVILTQITNELRYASAASIAITADTNNRLIQYSVNAQVRSISWTNSGADAYTLLFTSPGGSTRLAKNRVQLITVTFDPASRVAQIDLDLKNQAIANSPILNNTTTVIIMNQ